MIPTKTMYFATRNENPNVTQRAKQMTREQISVYDAFGGRCHYCNSSNVLVFDHKVPKQKGGGNEEGNLILSCWACNSSKGNKDYDEFVEIITAEKIAFQLSLQCLECV
jgi:5-methylcytosine-specific restriction endonuclease McrA